MNKKLAYEPVSLLVGLGNPGAEYEDTRHNAGAWLVELVAEQCSAPLATDKKFHGKVGRARIGSSSVHLLIPDTYMNLSGQAVSAIAQFYKIPPEAILIVHDELDIDPGTIRLKLGGGHGGHNGLRDIIQSLGNRKDFQRLRVGIGHPGDSRKVSSFVLNKPPSSERELIQASIDEAIRHLPEIVSGEGQKVMNQLHRYDARK